MFRMRPTDGFTDVYAGQGTICLKRLAYRLILCFSIVFVSLIVET